MEPEETGAAPLPQGGLARLYGRLKQGKNWALILCGVLAVWLPLSPWLDPDLGRINFFLSTEASLSQALSYAGEMTILAGLAATLAIVLRLIRDLSAAVREVEAMSRRNLEISEMVRNALALDDAARDPARQGLGAPDRPA